MPAPRSLRPAFLLAMLGPSLWVAPACTPQRTPEETLIAYTRAIQDEDAAALYCLSAGAAGSESLGAAPAARREAFARWLAGELRAHDEGSDAGEVELTGQGVRLVKLFALGAGTYYREVGRESVGEAGLVLRTRLELAYSQIDLSGLSPGTTFYLAGAPLGRVVRVRVPAGPRDIQVEALETVMLDWKLLREEPSDGCPGGFKVAEVEPVAGSEQTRSFTWAF